MRGQKTIKVLIVDDQEMMHIALRNIFRKQQDLIVAGEVFNGAEAIKFVQNICPDAITMDINMPEMNGIETTKKIISLVPHTVIIGLSMHSSSEMVKDIIKAGASNYITKDEAFERICSTIRKEVASKK